MTLRASAAALNVALATVCRPWHRRWLATAAELASGAWLRDRSSRLVSARVGSLARRSADTAFASRGRARVGTPGRDRDAVPAQRSSSATPSWPLAFALAAGEVSPRRVVPARGRLHLDTASLPRLGLCRTPSRQLMQPRAIEHLQELGFEPPDGVLSEDGNLYLLRLFRASSSPGRPPHRHPLLHAPLSGKSSSGSRM
jgi:hypothetical protein